MDEAADPSEAIIGHIWEAASTAAQSIPGFLGSEDVGRAGVDSEQFTFEVAGQRFVISIEINDVTHLLEEGSF